MIAPQHFVNDQHYAVADRGAKPTTGILPAGWREALNEVERLKGCNIKLVHELRDTATALQEKEAENTRLRNEVSLLKRELGDKHLRLQKMANLIQGNP